jgi:hypothetical protein
MLHISRRAKLGVAAAFLLAGGAGSAGVAYAADASHPDAPAPAATLQQAPAGGVPRDQGALTPPPGTKVGLPASTATLRRVPAGGVDKPLTAVTPAPGDVVTDLGGATPAVLPPSATK